MKRVLTGLVLAFSAQAFAAPVVIAPPYPLRRTGGVLEAGLYTGRPALTAEGILGPRNGGSNSFLLSAAFPLPGLGPDWMVGAAAGIAGSAVEPARYISASHYSWELVAGRAQIVPFGSDDTGLRGYFEVVLRDQRPQFEATANSALFALGLGLREHNLSVGVRMGASNDQLGSGLVEQTPPRFAVAVQGGAHLPFSEQGLILTLRGEVTHMLWRPVARFGLAASFLSWTKKLGSVTDANEPHPLAANLSRRYSIGPVFDLRFARRYLVRLVTDVAWITTPSRTLFSPPGVLVSTSVSY
jgi:hypothetical protein